MSYGQQTQFRIDLATARTGNGELFRASGKKIQVTGASSFGAIAQVSIIQEGYSPFYDLIDQGYVYDGQGFDGFYVKNTAQAGEWLVLTVSDEGDDFEYYKPTSNAISEITAPVKTHGGASVTTGVVNAAAAATLVMAANANRTGWVVCNNGANTIFIGGSTVTTANGMPVLPGDKYGEDSTAAVYAIVAAATEELRYREIVA